MKISLRCPCGAIVTTGEESAGKRGRCPFCGRISFGPLEPARAGGRGRGIQIRPVRDRARI